MNQTMNILQKKFSWSLRWSCFECITYSVIFAAHQIFLFNTIDALSYGLISTLYSCIFMIVFIISFGFNYSLVPLFKTATESQSLFKQIIINEWKKTTLIILALLPCIFFVFYLVFNQTVSISVLAILCILILTESIKKTSKNLTGLAFLNDKKAIIEISTIAIYTATFWLSYFITGTISLHTAFLPLLLASIFSTGSLLIVIDKWYRMLPQRKIREPKNLIRKMYKNRSFLWLNEITETLFSGNFLTPFFATICGFEYAGIIKLISTFMLTLQKMFNITSSALFAQSKSKNTLEKYKLLHTANTALYKFLLFLMIIGLISYFNTTISSEIALTIALVFLLSLVQKMVLTSEKFLISEEKSKSLLIFNVFNLIALYTLISYKHICTPNIILLGMILIRLTLFISYQFYIPYFLQIKRKRTKIYQNKC